jgi:hypothetical protein
MKGSTPIEVMKAIVDNDGPIRAYVARWDGDWMIADVSGVILNVGNAFRTANDSYSYCSLTGQTIKKTRPMTARELALWMIKHPTYAVTCKDWGKESWTHDITWATAMSKNPSNWSYADLEDLEFPRWEPIPETEAD